jgi:hypothetical protein
MQTVPADQLAAILGNANFTTRTQVITPTGPVTIPIETGSSGVAGTMGQQVGRTAAINVTGDLLDAGLLNPVTDKVYLTVQMPGYPDIPLFYGRVNDDFTRTNPGQVTVRCTDPADDVVNHDFAVPWAATQNGRVSTEIRSIIRDVDATYGVDTAAMYEGTITGSQVWEDSRGQALDDLAAATNNLWQATRAGSFVVYANPYANPTVYAPTLVFKDNSPGVLVKVEQTRSRANIFNAVTIIVDRTDLTAPIRVTIFDNDPASLTYYGGPFGKRNKNVKLQTPNNVDEAVAMGLRLLRQYLGLTESWNITLPFFPLFDQGDVFSLWYRDVVYPLVVESYTFAGLDGGTATQVVGRSLKLIDPTLAGIT